MYETKHMEQNVIADVHLPIKGEQSPFHNKKEYMKEYHQRPEVKKHLKEYHQRPEVKEYYRKYMKQYYQRPEVKEHHKEHMREYNQRPEVKERRREYQQKYRREYNQRPEVKERRREYRQHPKVKKRNKKYMKQYYQRPEVKERRREYKREYRKKRYWSDLDYREKRKKAGREWYWNKKEVLGVPVEKRVFINNCVICRKNISMLPAWSKLCTHCREKHLHELGTNDFSTHMRRRYDHTIDKVIPDFNAERNAIDIQMRECGLR